MGALNSKRVVLYSVAGRDQATELSRRGWRSGKKRSRNEEAEEVAGLGGGTCEGVHHVAWRRIPVYQYAR